MTDTNIEWPPSLWAAVTPAPDPAPALKDDAEVDVLVIGGGFSGLSTALHLAKRGRQVILVEARAIGWGASGRNNGQVIPTMSAVEPDAFVQRFGETGERFARLIGQSAETLFRLAETEGIDCEAEQTGWFQPAHSPGRLRLSEKRVKAWQRFGAPAELLDAQASAKLLGSRYWFGGMFNPTGGHINPLALVRGLAAACRRHGVAIYERSPVIDYKREGDGWRARCPKGSVCARAVVLATNAYTDALESTLEPRISHSVVPILSWQMATEPIGDNLRAEILPGRQAVSDTRADLRFFRYDARSRLITGGSVLGNRNAAARVTARTRENLAAAFPQLAGINFTHVWSGRVGMTRDRFPHFHRLGPDLWSWTGCNGRGVALSVALGRELASIVDGKPANESALPLTEPEAIPFHSIARRIAPLIHAWYKRRDHAELKLD
ncbi:FAD-dependent oxidoreductase [Chelativorans sp. M5D2P16]|uniref:NAD(P)/FAD-dependent oxidoreductase n=1 Tax=Chelativorans sp. M5D2P16 TaxID=3095678 RepID=UPI002ACA3C55|nr:FAD-dependent oxidoreductase [Chelativorans sp. M5D2P16]MDZ5697423.1 FAD-dependent oxidoreductase [Chelativorans sp. M5D2P16]